MRKLMAMVLTAVFAVTVFAAEIDVVKQLTPDATTTPVLFKLTAEDIAAVQAGMGNQAPVRAEYSIYPSKGGAVVIEEQMGKWAVIKLAVLVDSATKTVKKIEIISMNEKRGAGIKQPNFTGQFSGKGISQFGEINKEIRAVSGATVSSKAVFFAAKRALLVYGQYAAGK